MTAPRAHPGDVSNPSRARGRSSPPCGPAPPDGADLADGLVRLSAQTLPVSRLGLALMTDEGPAGTVSASDGGAPHVEELQFPLGQGPRVGALRTGGPVVAPDLAGTSSRRWPQFTASAGAVGVLRAVFATAPTGSRPALQWGCREASAKVRMPWSAASCVMLLNRRLVEHHPNGERARAERIVRGTVPRARRI